jgi:hypothetical protein
MPSNAPPEEFNDQKSVDETTRLLSSPINAARLFEAIAELEAGRGVAHPIPTQRRDDLEQSQNNG